MTTTEDIAALAREQIRRAKREVDRLADDLIAALVCAKRGCLSDSHIDHLEGRLRELKEAAATGQRWEREMNDLTQENSQ